MAAADSLARANVSFVVLESSNRTGGRSHALPTFGHPDVWTGVIERGSNWVSGVSPPGTHNRGGAAGVRKHMENLPAENPVHVLARQENLSMVRIPGAADGNMSLYEVVYTPNGTDNGDPGALIRTAANRALDCLNRTGPSAGPDVTVRKGLQKCGWDPKSAEEWAVDWAMSGEDANGEPAREQELSGFAPDETYVREREREREAGRVVLCIQFALRCAAAAPPWPCPACPALPCPALPCLVANQLCSAPLCALQFSCSGAQTTCS
jgi:hypothetical protein